ncbi:MAG TPA: hypothetical protein VHV31_08620 [Nitrolancea sp.]|jgi:hypothetical protein|nr:hypothetical protein [Nitrolancea sp.]
MTDSRDVAAEQLEEIATELERAAQHCRVAATHYRERNVPRAAAHAWAAQGHVHHGNGALLRLAEEHAAHAVPRAD